MTTSESSREERKYSVLILEDDDNLASLLARFLEKQGWEVQCESTSAAARAKVTEQVFDLVVADYFLPDANGVSIFDEIQLRSPLTKIILITGAADISIASEAFRRGANDLIAKPFTMEELRSRIQRVLEAEAEEEEISKTASAPLRPQRMVGDSIAMRRIFKLIELVAKRDATVLVTGESGTGKELVARAVHEQSGRRRHNFVAINCGAIPEHLLEDELFGHVRGAYTDARESRSGRFEQAHKGTLFLDEIGNMPLALQIKLLRVLEQREFQRLGSNQTVRVDIRLVAATNADLAEKVQRGEFREDLFYRLNVVPMELPPLRRRRTDIPLLANHFLAEIGDSCGSAPSQLEPSALKLLLSYDWPGNVRELRNLLEFASVLSGDRRLLSDEDFPSISGTPILEEAEETVEELERARAAASTYPSIPDEGIDLNQVVSDLEKHLICQSLRRTNGNKGKAARLLYLKRTTLVEKLRRMKLLDEFSPSSRQTA